MEQLQIATLTFRIDKKVAALISEDAEKNHTNESTILRQIIFKHYENDARTQTAECER
jgi:predicted transcriptional regulator